MRPTEPTPPALETDPRFKSGRYRGFYLQFGRRTPQELTLAFADGRLEGWGTDPVGRFAVAGTYDISSGRAICTKQYPGQHTVHYDMTAEVHNGLWGLWQIRGTSGDHGGFQLWPVGGPGADATREVEADAPVDTREPVECGA